MKSWIGCLTLIAAATGAVAADVGAGKAKVEAVCSACHGINGVSVADAIPNLAGQKAAYREVQLKALKDGSRKNPVMGAMAAQLSADDIGNVAAYFAALQAAKDGRDLPNGAYLFAEVYSAKLDADKKPITGADGFFVADQLIFYTAMARDAGWGKDIPDMLRNEEWNYAVFTLAKQQRPGVNQAECLACHKPLDKASYTFTLN